jgi:hypothetical protein
MFSTKEEFIDVCRSICLWHRYRIITIDDDTITFLDENNIEKCVSIVYLDNNIVNLDNTQSIIICNKNIPCLDETKSYFLLDNIKSLPAEFWDFHQTNTNIEVNTVIY